MQRKTLGLAVLLVAAVVAAYRPALNAGFVWNDDTYVTDNPTLDGYDGLDLIWTEPKANEQYYPMVFSSFWIEKRLWGLRPFGYHLVNVLLHAGSALLLWRFLLRLGLPGAWLAAAAFALHPMCVESVAWVTERKNTLSLFLSLLAMLMYLTSRKEREGEKTGDSLRKGKGRGRSLRAAVTPARHPRSSLAGFLGFSFFVLALFAKTTAVVVPAVLLVLVWWKEGRIRRENVRPLVPFFLVGVGLAAYTAWFERTMVRATGGEWALGLAERVVLAGKVVAFYLGKLVFPTGLAFIYPRWAIDSRALREWIPALLAAAVVGAAFLLRERIGRGPLAAALLFGGVLFPAMGFFNVYAMRYSWVADHFAYQAVVVFTAAVVCGVASILSGTSPSTRRAVAASFAAVLAAYGALTFVESRTYRSEDTLWAVTLARNPTCFMCETNYGHWLLNNGRESEAVLHFEKSLRLKADNVPALLNLGRIAEQGGRLDEAAARLRTALHLDPNDTLVLINLATVNTKAGRLDEAVAEYREALRLGSPDDYLAHNGLGAALMGQGKVTEAIEHFREVLRLRPDYAHGRDNLERALAVQTAPR